LETIVAALDDRPATTDAFADTDVAARMGEAYEAAQRLDYSAALAIWGPLAHAGVARAQNNVGACFADGLGVERDHSLAFRWLTLAAEGDDPVGQRNLAALYFKARASSRIRPVPATFINELRRPATGRRRTC
jgi:TPR repeat protein